MVKSLRRSWGRGDQLGRGNICLNQTVHLGRSNQVSRRKRNRQVQLNKELKSDFCNKGRSIMRTSPLRKKRKLKKTKKQEIQKSPRQKHLQSQGGRTRRSSGPDTVIREPYILSLGESVNPYKNSMVPIGRERDFLVRH